MSCLYNHVWCGTTSGRGYCGAPSRSVQRRLALQRSEPMPTFQSRESEMLNEAVDLLERFVKYVKEDRAVTPGFTRLERLRMNTAVWIRNTRAERARR